MKARASLSRLVLCIVTAVAITSCSKNVMGPEPPATTGGGEQVPEGFPSIPRPTSLNVDTPDTSEVYTLIVPVEGKHLDFAPVWEAGRFTWDVDIQTQYEHCPLGMCQWDADPPGDYWNGTRHSSELRFENNVVDLRSPTPFGTSWHDPHPRRLEFIKDGQVLATPINPERSSVLFQFQDHPEKRLNGALFGGYVELQVDPAFGEKERRRVYYVAATACPQIASPVYIKRERFWKRLPLVSNGTPLMSMIVDPGATFEVSYTWSTGVDYGSSYTFTRSLSGEISAGSDKTVVGAKLGGQLSEAFTDEVHVTEEKSVTVSKTLTGIPDKTTVYSVWTTVERYTFVDKDGLPYSDPNFTFSDLGSTALVGNREYIASTSFPKQ
jgi:hypothetical protein